MTDQTNGKPAKKIAYNASSPNSTFDYQRSMYFQNLVFAVIIIAGTAAYFFWR